MRPLDTVLDFVGNKLDHATPNELEMFFKSLAEMLPAPARQEAAKAAYHFHHGVRAQTRALELLAELLKKTDPPRPAKQAEN
jgi:hypothetical protein